MGRYYRLFLLTILSMVFTILYASRQMPLLFIRELYLILFLLIVASVGLFTIRAGHRLSYLLTASFFAAIILNAFYLHVSGLSSRLYLVVLAIFGFMGFFCSIRAIPCRKVKKYKVEVVEDLEDYSEPEQIMQEKVAAAALDEEKKTAKKKTVKKKPSRKKAVKKKAKKAAKKKAVKKKKAAER